MSEGYRKVEEGGAAHFHQVASKSDFVEPSYGQKTVLAEPPRGHQEGPRLLRRGYGFLEAPPLSPTRTLPPPGGSLYGGGNGEELPRRCLDSKKPYPPSKKPGAFLVAPLGLRSY